MSIIEQAHRWRYHWLDTVGRYDYTRPIRLRDSQAIALLYELVDLYMVHDNSMDIRSALRDRDPWRVLRGATLLGHPVVRHG